MKKIKNIAFIGIGLINSSLARDLREKNFYQKSSAYSRTKKTRNILKKLKIVDKVEDSYANTVRDADLIVIGVPVEAFSSVIKKISNHLKQGAIVTDVGSVKKSLVNVSQKVLSKEVDFIPGHPIAGIEKSGPEYGFKELFQNNFSLI